MPAFTEILGGFWRFYRHAYNKALIRTVIHKRRHTRREAGIQGQGW